MLKKIIMALIIANMSLSGMEENPIRVPDQIKDALKEEAQRGYYYPDVLAAQQDLGKVLAHHYFSKDLQKTFIVGCIAYPKALKFWRFGSNLPEAGQVVPLVKDWTEKVLTRTFQKRRSALGGLYIDQELFEAVEEINTNIMADQKEMTRFLKIKPIVEKFSTEVIVPREGPGHY